MQCGDSTRVLIPQVPHGPEPHDNVRLPSTRQHWTCLAPDRRYALRRDGRLIQSTTVRLPSVLGETHSCAARVRAGFWCTSLQARMCSMTVVIMLKIEELYFQICGRPEEHAVETLAPDGAYQTFDKWMRQRHVRHGLDCLDVEDPQICLPLVEPIQRIVVIELDATRRVTKYVGCGLRVTRLNIRSSRVGLRPIANRENPPDDILIKGNAEDQGDLLSDPRTPPRRISLFHGDDRVHHFLGRSLRARLLQYLEREQFDDICAWSALDGGARALRV